MFNWYKKVVFENYANFSGRARRSEYWYYYLCNLILMFLLYIPLVAVIIINRDQDDPPISFFLIIGLICLYGIATIIPTLAVTVRRLHDIGKSGWYYLISLIPLVGPIVLLVWMATEGEPNENQWGKNPKMQNDSINDIGRTIY